MKAAGKIGHLGITAHSLTVFERALTLDWVETIMFPYNIVESQGAELIKVCAEKNIGFIAMKPLAVKASACVECGECETRCPYQLPIREMLKKAAADFGE